MEALATPEVTLHGRTMTIDMVEISGFGGSYELGCRLMVLAGVEHLTTKNPQSKPQVGHYEGIAGIDKNLNEDAEALTKAMLAAPIEIDGKVGRVGDDCTGAMVQYSKMHAIHAAKDWNAYCIESRELRAKEEGGDGVACQA